MSLIIYVISFMSIIGFILMASDKGRAIRRKHRIKESTIWLMTLFGGAIGTTLGMYTFRHKTKHTNFAIGLPLIALIHIGLLFYII